MLKYVVRSHPGCIRKKNEDCFYVPADSGPLVFAVADGMGGHVAGEIASAAAVQTLEKNIPFLKQVFLAPDQGKVRAFFKQIILEANENILNMQLQKPELKGMGTTFTAAVFFDGNKLAAGHLEGSQQHPSLEPAGRSDVLGGHTDDSQQPLSPEPAGRSDVLGGHTDGGQQPPPPEPAGHGTVSKGPVDDSRQPLSPEPAGRIGVLAGPVDDSQQPPPSEPAGHGTVSKGPVDDSRQPLSPEPTGRNAALAGPVDGSQQSPTPKPTAGRCTVLAGHVGDSQLHLFNKAGHTQITEDHSVVMELLKNGEIKADEIYTHPQRNFLTRALGTGPALKVDFYTAEIVSGDYIVLCTDGLTAMLRPQEIGKIVLQGPDLETAADVLISRANALGGLDNITFVLINYLER